MDIAYFVHEVEDPAVRRRVRTLSAAGARLSLFGFARGRHEAAAATGPEPHILGRTAGGRLLARIGAVALAIPRAWGLRRLWARADVIVARNLEMLAVVVVAAALAGSRARVVYECLDIHRLMLSDGLSGKLLRAIERACLKRAALVMTSSPAFVERYFHDRQTLAIEAVIVENKVIALEGPPPAPAGAPPEPSSPPPPWKIAWCGVIRCKRSFEILAQLARDFEGRVEVVLWGAPALDQIPDFHEAVAAAPHLVFKGRYAYEDLPRIYADAHFVWAVDYYEAGGNSDWLLPNRLYEGLCYGAVPLAVEGVETARWLRRHGVGVVLGDPLADSVHRFFESCTAEDYDSLRVAVAELEKGATTLSRTDAQALLAQLAGPGA